MRLKEFIRNEKLMIKETKFAGSEQKAIGNKPIFVKLVNFMDQKVRPK